MRSVLDEIDPAINPDIHTTHFENQCDELECIISELQWYFNDLEDIKNKLDKIDGILYDIDLGLD